MTQHLIADIGKIEQFKKHFKLVDKDSINWTETYIDDLTNSKWLFYRVDTYLQGGGYSILARQPLPDTKELIRLSLFSENNDEVFAACRTLADNEQVKQIDFRSDLINGLENIDDHQRQKEVIKLTGLDNPINRQEIIGKSFDEINATAKLYKDIARRAEQLKQ